MLNIKGFIKSLFKTSRYISGLDQFLKTFDKNHPKRSKSQNAERKKYNRIYQLRDNKILFAPNKTFWDKF